MVVKNTEFTDTRLAGPVAVIGAGLLGTSVALALRNRGVEVYLADQSEINLQLAIDYGAGRKLEGSDQAELVVVAVSPESTASVVDWALKRFPNALVTDVASVKLKPLQQLRELKADLSRYLGTHPMAGRERGGPISARADLFLGRPWVLAGHESIKYRDAAPIEALILDLGAVPIEMTVEEHDRSVALVSHLPQLVSSLLAARLVESKDEAISLAGQGIRDVTRIAASNPELWLQILKANSAPVLEVLKEFSADLNQVISALSDFDTPGALSSLAEIFEAGNNGVRRLPGKHGSNQQFSQLIVLVDDKPGELARLLKEIGDTGINLEDLRLEHSPGAKVGIAEIAVLPSKAEELSNKLNALGWKLGG